MTLLCDSYRDETADKMTQSDVLVSQHGRANERQSLDDVLKPVVVWSLGAGERLAVCGPLLEMARLKTAASRLTTTLLLLLLL